MAFPVITFSFVQWTLKDSWLPVLFSVFLFLPVTVFIGYSAFLAYRWTVFDDWPFHSPLWGRYLSKRHRYFLPLLLALLIKSAFLAFGQASGMTQAIALVTIEGLVFVSLVLVRPYETRREDILAGFLAFVRLACAGLMIAFLPSLGVKAINRVIIGIAIVLIFSVAVVVMFFNTVWNILQPLLPKKSPGPPSPHPSNSSTLEKGGIAHEVDAMPASFLE